MTTIVPDGCVASLYSFKKTLQRILVQLMNIYFLS